jgi:hypothetical protein
LRGGFWRLAFGPFFVFFVDFLFWLCLLLFFGFLGFRPVVFFGFVLAIALGSWAKRLVQKKGEFFFSGLGQKKEGKKSGKRGKKKEQPFSWFFFGRPQKKPKS